MLVDHTMASVTQTASSAVYASAMWESMWERRGCCGLVQGHLFCETARSRGRWDESCVRRPCLWLAQGQAARAGRWPPRRRARLSVRGAFGEDLFERIELETDRRERISRKLDAAYSTSFPLLFLPLPCPPRPSFPCLLFSLSVLRIEQTRLPSSTFPSIPSVDCGSVFVRQA